MEPPYEEALLEALGPRYRLGARRDGAVELEYRFGKAAFRPSRFVLRLADEDASLELSVDVRIPAGKEPSEADALVEALEQRSLTPRRFERTADETATMTSESGQAAGQVRSLGYVAPAAEVKDAAARIRAIVETLDIPIVVGIHEPEDLVAKKPLPPPKKRGTAAVDPLDRWEYTLTGGVLRSLTVVIDPNVRTLDVVERKLLSRRNCIDTLKLAQVAKLGLRETSGEVELVAVKRDGSELSLAKSLRDPEFVATAKRMAEKIFINLERM